MFVVGFSHSRFLLCREMLWGKNKYVHSLILLNLLFICSGKALLIFCVVVAPIGAQLSMQSAELDVPTSSVIPIVLSRTPEEVHAKNTKTFYAKINETLLKEHYLYPKRVECIMDKLQKQKTHEKMSPSFFIYSGDENDLMTSDIMNNLETPISDASFTCTIVGYCAIVIVTIVMVVLVTCVAFLSRKK